MSTVEAAPPSLRIGSVIRGNNAKLIATIAPLYLTGRTICDLTYGHGSWWTRYRQPDTAFTGDYTQHIDLPAESFGAVAYDPAYVSVGGKGTTRIPERFRRYGLDKVPAGVARVFADMVAGQREAARICQVGGFVLQKCQQQVESGRLHDVPTWLKISMADIGRPVDDPGAPGCMVLVDEIIHARGLGPQPLKNRDGTWRTWQRTQRAHSHLLVFRKTRPIPTAVIPGQEVLAL